MTVNATETNTYTHTRTCQTDIFILNHCFYHFVVFHEYGIALGALFCSLGPSESYEHQCTLSPCSGCSGVDATLCTIHAIHACVIILFCTLHYTHCCSYCYRCFPCHRIEDFRVDVHFFGFIHLVCSFCLCTCHFCDANCFFFCSTMHMLHIAFRRGKDSSVICCSEVKLYVCRSHMVYLSFTFFC